VGAKSTRTRAFGGLNAPVGVPVNVWRSNEAVKVLLLGLRGLLKNRTGVDMRGGMRGKRGLKSERRKAGRLNPRKESLLVRVEKNNKNSHRLTRKMIL